MIYRVLPSHLHGTADAAAKYFTNQLGLKSSSIMPESEVNPNVDFRPTLQAISGDKHIICIEIVEKLYPPEINNFILSCRNHSIPAKLYCVFPFGAFEQVDVKAIQFATENGIALYEVNPVSGNGKHVIGTPVSLSLGGLRPFRLTDFPSKYRASLKGAIDTFKGGNPSKGCAQVYDELEQLTRRIGKKCHGIPGALKKRAGFDWEKEAWHNEVEFLKANLDRTAAACPELKHPLLSRVAGITEYRNETGHKPSSVDKLIARDISLKTRFESAMDELLNLITAVKPLRV
jgi:hypothetical protein